MTNSNDKQQPVFKKQLRGVATAVFESENKDGKKYRSINLQRSFLKNGKWERRSIYLNHADIPFVIEALQSTWNFLNDYPISSSETDQEINDSEESQQEDASANVADEAA